MHDILGKSKWLVTAAVFALFVGPTFISYQPYLFKWDDADYLKRSIAVSRAFWSWNIHGLKDWMVTIRPPAMTLLGIPWGPLATWDDAGKCFITLATVISLLAACCLYLLLRIGVKPWVLLAGSACVFASLGPYPQGSTPHFIATGIMADSLFAWTCLAAVLLIPYEARTPCPSIGGSVGRGILWGWILSLGAMTKLNFLFFALAVLPIVFVIRTRRAGLRHAVTTMIAFICCAAPSAIYLVRWGKPAFDNARASSFGPLANLYYRPLPEFLGSTIREMPGLVLSFLLVATALIYLVSKRRINVLEPGFLVLLIVAGFGAIVLASTNRVIRFEFPAIVALPFLTAILISGRGYSVGYKSAALAAGLVFCGLVVAGLPMRHRADSQSLSRCDTILAQAARCNAKSILLATDSPTLNQNLMDVALMVSPPGVSVKADSLAYHAMFGAPIEADFRAISESDEVVFQDRDASSPAFTNGRVVEYERYLRQGGYVSTRISDDLTVYSRRCER